MLRQHGKSHRCTLVRWPQLDETLMVQIADLHNVDGFYVATAFPENHNSHIFHANPREFHVSKSTTREDGKNKTCQFLFDYTPY
ncbi:hypothetical protein BDV30DRAFT_15358 [Aspergillus minisclerotigenes]|uniref:Uncharacterized protein n=1 Tax=Aspergillus minisclerotigenes TaxID=656917 RepID=A0A5N6IPF5_9EURO|nr:hypothetical protein BDV30DRAFT_15358 [Aspergillus minisclerotigenes]